MPTVRERVRAAQAEMSQVDLALSRMCQIEADMTSLLGNVHEEIRKAEMAYNVALARALEIYEARNRADASVKAMPVYERLLEARHVLTEVTEMIRSLRLCVRTSTEEMRLAR